MGHKHSNFVAYGLGIMSSGSCHTEGLTGKACNPRERRPAQSMHKSSLTHGFVQRGLRGLFTTVIHLDLFRCCHGLRTLLMVRNMRTQKLFFPGIQGLALSHSPRPGFSQGLQVTINIPKNMQFYSSCLYIIYTVNNCTL